MRSWELPRDRAWRSKLSKLRAPGYPAGQGMKQINVFPMVIMLIVVVLLIAWFGGYFS